jgi:hypothetical protein
MWKLRRPTTLRSNRYNNRNCILIGLWVCITDPKTTELVTMNKAIGRHVCLRLSGICRLEHWRLQSVSASVVFAVFRVNAFRVNGLDLLYAWLLNKTSFLWRVTVSGPLITVRSTFHGTRLIASQVTLTSSWGRNIHTTGARAGLASGKRSCTIRQHGNTFQQRLIAYD